MKVIVEQGDLIDALVALMKDEDAESASEILRKLVKESKAVMAPEPEPSQGFKETVRTLTAEVDRMQSAATPAEPTKEYSALEIRINELREQHGPVFVIQPPHPVEPCQKIKWRKGSEDHTVEILEKADLAGPTGKVIAGGWFAKLLDL